MILREYPDESSWLETLLLEWRALGGEAVARRGAFQVALCGGSTPGAFYRALARSDWPWSATHLFIGDERCVGPEHKDSNYRMIFESLYPKKPVLHRWKTEMRDYASAALDYEHLIKRETGDPPKFDLILLGVGDDGHTASLFPGTTALEESIRPVVVHEVPQLKAKRLTFTYPAFKRARAVWFLTRGTRKKTWVDRMAAGEASAFPAARVHCDLTEPVIHHCAA
ncbi:MAG: 6-phosphogluconolactonase [Candidatus Methylacidiphilales bacterium]|nr:6-phosphogluconolactonase [Candidatus Methylacidiphilales bacterium]